MRYYTKDWYNMLHKQYYTEGLTIIPDKDYSEEEIIKLQEDTLKRYIKKEEELYNTPPLFEPDLFLDLNNFRPENYIELDESTGEERNLGSTYEEVKDKWEKFWLHERKRFENRSPFDLAECIAEYEILYEDKLNNLNFPEWVKEQVDKRILALNLMPKRVFLQLKQEERESLRAFKRMDRLAQKRVKQEWDLLPQKMKEYFGIGKNRQYEEACILFLYWSETDIIIELRKGEWGYGEGDTPYDRIIFKNARLLERDETLQIECYMENGEYFSECQYLMEELYRVDNGNFAFHLLAVSGEEVGYITIECEDIKCCRNRKREELFTHDP